MLLFNLTFFFFSLSLICSFQLLYSAIKVMATYTKATCDCIMLIRVEPEY